MHGLPEKLFVQQSKLQSPNKMLTPIVTIINTNSNTQNE